MRRNSIPNNAYVKFLLHNENRKQSIMCHKGGKHDRWVRNGMYTTRGEDRGQSNRSHTAHSVCDIKALIGFVTVASALKQQGLSVVRKSSNNILLLKDSSGRTIG